MCVIAQYDKLKPELTELEAMANSNRAGAGIGWFERRKDKRLYACWEKGLTAKALFDRSQELPLPQVVHFRLATVGGVSDPLCHPFPISYKVELFLSGYSPGAILFHNGHVNGWQDMLIGAGKPDLQGAMSDSRAMAYCAARNGYKWLDNLTGCWLVMDAAKKEIHRFGPWIKHGDVFYSNRRFAEKSCQGFARSYDWEGGCWEHDLDRGTHRKRYDKPSEAANKATPELAAHPENCMCAVCDSRRKWNERMSKYDEVRATLADTQGIKVHPTACSCPECLKHKVVKLEGYAHLLDHPTDCACKICSVLFWYDVECQGRLYAASDNYKPTEPRPGSSYAGMRLDQYVRNHEPFCSCGLCMAAGCNGYDKHRAHVHDEGCNCLHCRVYDAGLRMPLAIKDHLPDCLCEGCVGYCIDVTELRKKDQEAFKASVAKKDKAPEAETKPEVVSQK